MPYATGTWGAKAKKRSKTRNAYFLKYRAATAIKWKARAKLEYAIRIGMLSKHPCRDCGRKDGRLEAHHPDYSKPLEVVWFCPRHHRDEHGRIRKGE